jgi:hypothetical protein
MSTTYEENPATGSALIGTSRSLLPASAASCSVERVCLDCRTPRRATGSVRSRHDLLAAAARAIATHYVQVDVSLDDHVQRVLASPAAYRRVLRDPRERHDCRKLGEARWRLVAEELQGTWSAPRPPPLVGSL